MEILWGRIKACINFYDTAGTIVKAGHLVFSEECVSSSAINGRIAMNSEKQGICKLEQHKFVVLSRLWTSE